jgi:hypothetical protein
MKDRSKAMKASWARRKAAKVEEAARVKVIDDAEDDFRWGQPSKIAATDDPVNHPYHYTSHPSGVECIQVTEHFNFCVGNAIKYIWRSNEKGNYVQDLAKAVWYLQREIARAGG